MPRMNPLRQLRSLALRDLEAIVTLAEIKHFGRASEICRMTQPALSALVRRVEDGLGRRLFDRTSRRFAITSDGALAVEAIEQLLRGMSVLEHGAAPAGVLRGPVRLGLIPTLGPYYVPHFLPQAITTFPDARFQFFEGLTEQLVAMVRTQRIDAAMLALPTNAEGLSEYSLFEEELVLALPIAHQAAAPTRLSHKDIPRQDLILLEHGHCLRTHTLEVCGRSGVGTVPVHATGLETLRFMVSAGIGCAIFPALAVNGDRTWRSLIAYRRFKSPAPTRTIGLISRSDSDGIRTARTLTSFLQTLNPPTTVE
jgi:LysR family hydrogen peroxide-inducible transcriptional activator